MFELCEKAKDYFKLNKDPYLIQSLSLIKQCFEVYPEGFIDDEEVKSMFLSAKTYIDIAIRGKCRSDSVAFYYRGLIHFYLNMFYEALLDFEMAIEKDDEPGAKFYLARGRSFACLSMLNEAIKDYSIAINLDKKCSDAYLCRGKCSYLIGDNA